MARLRTSAALLMFVTLAACHDKPATPTQPFTPVTITGIALFGVPTSSMGVGQNVHLRAATQYSDHSALPIAIGVVWTSSAPQIATIAPDGTLLAVSAGSTTITGNYQGYVATALVRVVDNWTDLDFRVAILNGTSYSQSSADVVRIFAKANDLLFERTGSRMRLIDMTDVGPGTPLTLAGSYMDARTGEQPDGIVVWTEDPTATSAGGFSQTLVRQGGYVNRVPATSGSNRVFVSAIDYQHRYGICGYDAETRKIRISDRSANGECRGVSGLTCVDNGQFWECPDVRNDFYAQPDVFIATTIVHEFLHPVGLAGNNDHYGTPTCIARVGMSSTEANDRARAQWSCGQCPDLFLRFRPSAAPSPAWRDR